MQATLIGIGVIFVLATLWDQLPHKRRNREFHREYAKKHPYEDRTYVVWGDIGSDYDSNGRRIPNPPKTEQEARDAEARSIESWNRWMARTDVDDEDRR